MKLLTINFDKAHRQMMDTSLTIEQLERDIWKAPGKDVSALIVNVYKARKKLLAHLSVEDLRLLISQGIGLKYTIPLAIELLKFNVLAEGDHYEGDLLLSVLRVDHHYWVGNIEDAQSLRDIYQENIDLIEQFDTTDEIKKEILSAYTKHLKSTT